MSAVFVSLPRSFTDDTGIVHVQEWKTHNHVVYQNCTRPIQSSDNPCGPGPQTTGQNLFHVYQVIQHIPAGEELGEELGTYTDLQAAMDFIARQEQLA